MKINKSWILNYILINLMLSAQQNASTKGEKNIFIKQVVREILNLLFAGFQVYSTSLKRSRHKSGLSSDKIHNHVQRNVMLLTVLLTIHSSSCCWPPVDLCQPPLRWHFEGLFKTVTETGEFHFSPQCIYNLVYIRSLMQLSLSGSWWRKV